MIRFYGMALSLLTLSMLSSCTGGGGGGGGESNISPVTGTLSGVAAVGSPIVNGNISVSCSAGSALSPTTTSSTGAWQVTLSGQTLPCAVEVSGGTISGIANTTPYHSIATATGTVNVTPLTDLMVANLAGTATPNIWFAGLSTTRTSLTAITQAQVDAALVKLRTALSGLTPLGSINPITVSFTPSSGNVSDDMLTALRGAMTNTGVTYESLLSNASLTAFAAPVTGFNTALVAAYSSTSSGMVTGETPSDACPASAQSDAWANVRLGCLQVGQNVIDLSSGASGQASDTAFIISEAAYDNSFTNINNGKSRFFQYFLCVKHAPSSLSDTSYRQFLATDMAVAMGLGNGGRALPNGIATAGFSIYGGDRAGFITTTCNPSIHPVIIDYVTGKVESINTAALSSLTIYDY